MVGDGTISPPQEAGHKIAVDGQTPNFTIDDLVAEVSSQLARTAEGMTIREICEAMGMPGTKTQMSRVATLIHDLIVTGKVRYMGKKLTRTVVGSMKPTPAYGLVEKKGGEGERLQEI